MRPINRDRGRKTNATAISQPTFEDDLEPTRTQNGTAIIR
jgi:hypothetical protein